MKHTFDVRRSAFDVGTRLLRAVLPTPRRVVR